MWWHGVTVIYSDVRFQTLYCRAMSLCFDPSIVWSSTGKPRQGLRVEGLYSSSDGKRFPQLYSPDISWHHLSHVMFPSHAWDLLVRWHTGADVAVCTIEKASTLLNRLLEEGSDWLILCVLHCFAHTFLGTLWDHVWEACPPEIWQMWQMYDKDDALLRDVGVVPFPAWGVDKGKFGNRDCVWFGNGFTWIYRLADCWGCCWWDALAWRGFAWPLAFSLRCGIHYSRIVRIARIVQNSRLISKRSTVATCWSWFWSSRDWVLCQAQLPQRHWIWPDMDT